MKIAIRGHKSRGEEVIQILESLGGRNTFNYNGDYIRTAYFIGMDYSIYGFCTDSPKVGFKVYTLEEFETQFPFKIGDKVITPDHKLYKIVAFENYNNKLCYKLDNSFHYVPQVLKPYKEMKEERNITLTLDKAKEWYKKGGELKETALQAFTEKELNPLPRSWEEFCKQGNPVASWRFVTPTKYEVLYKLEQLRDCWRQGWKPDWLNGNTKKYTIKGWRDTYIIESTYITLTFLSFPTYKMAEEFLKCFRDLIKKAGDLI